MFSKRIADKLYPVSQDISEIDLDTDVEQYNYDGTLVYRGNLDPEHSTDTVKVYWLYDENSIRVGLAEHQNDEHTTLWYRTTPFGTLLQEDWEAENRTIWSLMTEAAYEDCNKYGWLDIDALSKRTNILLITPKKVVEGFEFSRRCTRCLDSKQKDCLKTRPLCDFDITSAIFVDDDGVLYTPPSDSSVYATLRRRAGLVVSDVDSRTLPSSVGAGI